MNQAADPALFIRYNSPMRKITSTCATLCLLFVSLAGYGMGYFSKINGVSGEMLENVLKRLDTHRTSIQGELTQEQIQRLYDESPVEIKKALEPYGYFKATLTNKLEKLKNDSYRATFTVNLGPRIVLHQVDIQILGEASRDPEFIQFKKNLALKPGLPLNTNDYTQAKKQLLDLAATRGYFDATLTNNQLTINMQEYYADIVLSLDSGKRYQFGDVTFNTTDKKVKPLSNKFLARFIPFQRGDAFDMQKALLLQNNLSSSLYFESVTVDPQPQQAEGRAVPLNVDLTPAKGKKYSVGFGVGSDTGVRGLAGVTLRQVTDRGHYFSGQTRFAYKAEELRGYIQGSYNIPGPNPLKDLYTFSASLSQDDTEKIGLGQSIDLNASYLTEIRHWQQTTGISAHLERSDPTLERTFTSMLFIPNIQWYRTESDDPLKPTSGYRVKFKVQGASEKLLSTVDFLQAELNMKYLKEMNYYQRLVLRGDLGGVAIKNIDDLPVSMRFAAGGSQSVRGYGYHNIGPGRALVVGSVELQQRIYKEFFLTAFFDIGDASSSYVKNYNKAVGIGATWRSPIGAITVSLAEALDKPGKPMMFEFSMGPEL